MSHSPIDATGLAGDEYAAGWRAVNAMVREGRSWSGRERNCCFLNIGTERFANVSAATGLDFPDDARAVAAGDWDFDGAVDLWISNRTGPRVRLMRNVSNTENHFVAVRLEGRTCNRDAIGARVELYLRGEPERRLIKTLHAGDGFLAQSSKWLHFGLGATGEPKRLIVRWPGGKAEEFSGLEVDRRYRIVQGSGRIRQWSPPTKTTRLVPSELKSPPVSDQARIVLGARVPMPKLQYRAADAGTVSLNDHIGQPLLINLWASWCAPCITELNEWKAHETQLRASGLRIVSLSVDEESAKADAKQILKKLDWPFSSGFAATRLVDILDTLQRALLDRRRPVPVPSSFLVDAEDRLAVIYKGPISAEVLLADVAALLASPAEIRRAAVPFPGRWHSPRHLADLVSISQEFNKRGHTEIAGEYLASASGGSKDQVANAEYNLGVSLFGEGKHEEGIAAFERALQVDPDNWRAHNNIGIASAMQGRHDQALQHFSEVRRLQPTYVDIHLDQGRSLAALSRYVEAGRHFETLLQSRPDHISARRDLGSVLGALGRFDDAILNFREALRLSPNHPQTIFQLAVSYLRTGNLQAAQQLCDQLKSLQPKLAENLQARIRAQEAR